MEASAVPRSAPTGVTGVASPQLLRLASDARLVALIRQGWPAAFEAVYNRHHRGILSFCRHVLSDADEAEDAVQQTFLAAYNDLITSDKPIHLRAWLFMIARNRCYSILRSRREQPAAELEEPVTEGLATQVQRRQDLRDLVVDLRSLPDEQRAALVLAELDAFSHEEIGHVLGVPRDKVKALVFQARESLVASRTARETACVDIREQLSSGRGGALRRANLRRHLRDCTGCRDFRRQLQRQRRQMAALLPVVPTLALQGAVRAGTGSSAGFGGGVLASSALNSGIVKGFATLMLATAGTAGTFVATQDFQVRGTLGAASRPHLPSAKVVNAGLEPTLRRTSEVAPSISPVATVADPARHSPATIRMTLVTTPTRSGRGALNPLRPLVILRVTFPRQHDPDPKTIAPPVSTGKAPRLITPAPRPVSTPPTAAIASTSPGTLTANPKPVTDKPPTGRYARAVSTSNVRRAPGSVGGSGGMTSDGRPGASLLLRAGAHWARGSSGRSVPGGGSSERPVPARGTRGSSTGRSSGASSGTSGSRSVPAGGKPGVAGSTEAGRSVSGPAGTNAALWPGM